MSAISCSATHISCHADPNLKQVYAAVKTSIVSNDEEPDSMHSNNLHSQLSHSRPVGETDKTGCHGSIVQGINTAACYAHLLLLYLLRFHLLQTVYRFRNDLVCNSKMHNARIPKIGDLYRHLTRDPSARLVTNKISITSLNYSCIFHLSIQK